MSDQTHDPDRPRDGAERDPLTTLGTAPAPGDFVVEGDAAGNLIDTAYTGDPEGDRIDAGDAPDGSDDDVVDAGGGDDTVLAGAGDDTVHAGQGDDSVLGGAGDDTLLGDSDLPGGDFADGLPNSGDDTLAGGDGDDSIRGEHGDDLALGGAGQDTLVGGGGDDTLAGGAGGDTLRGGPGEDVILGDGAGNPVRFTVTGSEAEFENALIAYTIDVETGAISNVETLSEDVAGDIGRTLTYEAAPGAAVGVGIVNAEGTFLSSAYGPNIGLNADEAVHTAGLGVAPDGSVNIAFEELEGLRDADFRDIVLNVDLNASGTRFDNAHFDYSEALAGPSEAVGDGDDVIDGGAGEDLLFGQGGGDVITGAAGDDTIDGGSGADLLSGGDGADLILGRDGNDGITGGAGDDTITGGAGADLITGGTGADDLSGGDDRDTFGIGSAADGTGDSVDGGAGGDDADTLLLSGAGPFTITGRTTDPDGNSTSGTINFLDAPGGTVTGSMTFSEIENIVPCFTPGTRIATPAGERPVEALRPGDRVITRDNGLQEIRWSGRRDLSAADLHRAPHLRPVLIRAGALGQGLPERDMQVSPQHRVLIHSDRAALYFEDREVLAAARHLTGLDGVETAAGDAPVSYIHFMFDQHEVVLSDGAWTESFQPGEQTLDAMGQACRDEILALFPDLADGEGIATYRAARRALKRHEARLLVG